ncbi:family 20 glycosylhydrolase [uncultured Draconibacterium sp.]|uniref:family 20 glycosylhydrolase n=1 Tax=uncultured Draconibacterium sp. TaxID=1573823 RepID=UPI0025F37AA3|nr:family 20 glycosylhydrolase [uncultured Draconibacterium sp.]
MKTSALILFWVALILASCSNPGFKTDDISVVPQPKSLILKDGAFKFSSKTKLSVQDERAKKAATFLSDLFEKAAGFSLAETQSTTSNGILFQGIEGLSHEAYILQVSPKQITIQASSEAGFFYGVQTIRQLLPHEIERKEVTKANWLVPCVEVEDEPRFTWRGMHMDFSRHFFNIDEVKEFIDYLALYKLNTYHMHLTDDQGWRIEIKKYPLLTEKGAWRIENNQDSICNERAIENELYKIDESNYHEIDGQRMYGGFFTQEQIKEIVAYADERCITVLPEIDMPGHFKSAIDNYPYLSCNEESGWATVFTYPACLGKETTYEFMEHILAEVVELFPSEYIHIGGDEVNIESWEECEHCQSEIHKHKLKDEHELQSYFNRRIEKFLQSKGKQLMGWDEIVKGGLTEDASVMWWRNWVPDAPKTAARNGNKVVVTPTAAYYYDYLNDHNSMEKVYNYEPVPDDFTPDEANNVLGIQANLWSEWIPSFKRLQYQAFPRLQAMAETAWTMKENKDFENFFNRMEGQFARMDALDIYYYIPAVNDHGKNIAFVDSVLVNLDLAYAQAGVEIFYTLDGSVPTRNSLKYTAPFKVKNEGEIKVRSFLGEQFNDITNIKLVKMDYREAVEIAPEQGRLQLWKASGKFKSAKEIELPAAAEFQEVPKIDLGENVQPHEARIYKGYLYAAENGVYEFELKSDGESLFYFGDDVIIDKAKNWNPFRKTEKVALKKGWHAFLLVYKASEKPRAIELAFGVQGHEKVVIDKAVFGK